MTEAFQPGPIPTDLDRRTFDIIAAESVNGRIGIDPDGGHITSWQVRNPQGEFEDILYVGKTKKRTGIPTLFPYYGEAEGMRSHGFGRDSQWQVVAIEGSTIKMVLTDGNISEEARQEYPYPFEAAITIEAADDGSFIYKLDVKNTGTGDLPLSPGLHPYFAINHADKQKVTVDGIPDFDASSVAWDTNPPDTVFPYTGKTTVNIPGRKISIEDITEGGPVIEHAVVWSQTPQKDDYNFVCVEPITGGDNAIHDNPKKVAPGQEWSMAIRFSASIDAKAA